MFWFFVIAVFVAALIISVVQGNERAKEKEKRINEFEQKLNGLEGFTVTKKIVGIGNSYILALDQERKKIVFIKEHHKIIIPFSLVLSVEILEDNVMLSQKSSLRTIGGAVVGGAIAGGAGAIVGGLSGDSKQNKEVSKVQVKVRLRDINNPSFTIDCFDCKTMTIEGKPVKPTSTFNGYIYMRGVSDAQQIVDTLSVIIDATDNLEKGTSNMPPTSDIVLKVSMADELVKLAELKEKGILTEAEFDVQKKLILNVSQPIVEKESIETTDRIVIEGYDALTEVKEAVEKGEYIVAVSLYKKLTGCGLKEAKDYVDSIR